jgi:hypothetical protein
MDFDDGAGYLRSSLSFKIGKRLKLGMSTNLNYSIWNSGLDYGIGVGLEYNLKNYNE